MGYGVYGTVSHVVYAIHFRGMEMKIRLIRALVLPLALLPGMAWASFSAVVVNLAPVAAPTPGAVAVPAISSGLALALGVLLAVVGYRFLRHRPAYQKTLCLAVLAGGTLLSAWGVNRTTAGIIGVIVPVEDPVCSSGTIALPHYLGGYTTVPITNNCASTTLEVQSYEGLEVYCAEEDQIVIDAGVGDRIEPGQTASSNYCPPLT